MKASLCFSRAFATTLLTVIAVLASSSLSSAAGKKNPTSKLYVADVEGVAQIDTGERIEDLTKKSVFNAEGTVLETKPDATNASVLSNGTGLYLDKDTRIEIRRFQQEPFSPQRNDLEVEPSISNTQAFLSRGTVGLCTSKLIAGSSMNYETPHGSVAIRGRKVAIEVTEDETVISLLEGDVTVRADSFSGGEVLRPGQQAIIKRSAAGGPPSITIQAIPNDQQKGIDDRVSMACIARSTVYFDVAERQESNVFETAETDGDEIVPVPVLPAPPTNPTPVSAGDIDEVS